MSRTAYVHLIDEDSSRRAAIAYELHSQNIHTEIYEGLWEFMQRAPTSGAVLANDNAARGGVNEILDIIRRRRGRQLPVAMFAESPSPEKIVKAMSAGAYSYLQWPFKPGEVEFAIEEMMKKSAKDFSRAKKIAQAEEAVSTLSPREYDVLRLLVDGASNKEIARSLVISPRTVELHRSSMLKKLNAVSSADAVRIGVYAGVDE
jgi:FixJ family two-component response regulator